jgi:hypothetical protein
MLRSPSRLSHILPHITVKILIPSKDTTLYSLNSMEIRQKRLLRSTAIISFAFIQYGPIPMPSLSVMKKQRLALTFSNNLVKG